MLYHVSQTLFLPSRMGNADSIHEAVGLLVHLVHVVLGALLLSIALALLPPSFLHHGTVPVEGKGCESLRRICFLKCLKYTASTSKRKERRHFPGRRRYWGRDFLCS